MLNYISIKNFKSLKNISLDLKGLNLFLGLNSMGKSSVMHALLMLRQSYAKNNSMNCLYINGELVSLGNSKDIFFQNAAEDDYITFELQNKNANFEVSYCYKTNIDTLDSKYVEKANAEKLSLFGNRFFYLAANHIEPAKTYKTNNAASNYLNPIGNNGENVPYMLSKIENKKLENEILMHPKSKSDLVFHELDAWMSEITPGTKILAKEVVNLDIVKMTIQHRIKQKIADDKYIDEYTDKFSPVNVGFGIPYVLPLVFCLLTSQSNDLILIENPESHLHPRGQAQLGKLISLAAQNGAQILCETHSDHVINGMRVNVKKHLIDSDKIKLFYFTKSQETSLETEIRPIVIDKNGELSDYPSGLLDEWGNLMAELI